MNTSENNELEDLGATTEAVTEQASEPTEERQESAEAGDEAVQDTSEPARVEEVPDQAQAAAPVESQQAVVGRRNEDLPTETPGEAPRDTSADNDS